MDATTVLWHQRRNPLRRRSDVLAAWTGVTAAFLTAVGAPAVGAVTAFRAEDSALRQGQDMRRVAAVVTKDAAHAVPNAYTGSRGKVEAPVRWAAPDGSVHTGSARVDSDSPAGSITTVWVDRGGRIHEVAPPTPGQARVQGVVSGIHGAVGTGALLLAGRWAVRLRIDRRRADAWDREWSQVEPSWAHRQA
ncbi:hypothetical protein ACIP98_36770 [Streptomyces sp. NPDC088354]|uniref:Rv1733c family protein n=1 Tax=Streptomyces sp. NPDC088354 TaxID=3365856 RepID=UPI00380C1840